MVHLVFACIARREMLTAPLSLGMPSSIAMFCRIFSLLRDTDCARPNPLTASRAMAEYGDAVLLS